MVFVNYIFHLRLDAAEIQTTQILVPFFQMKWSCGRSIEAFLQILEQMS